MAESKTTTTVEYPITEFNRIVNRKLYEGREIKIEYVISEVGGDPMDRFPGRNEVTSVRISFAGVPPVGGS